MSMIQETEMNAPAGIPTAPSLGHGGIQWYAAYTCPRHEKRVAEHLAVRTVEHFLPLYESRRRWKDRQKLVAFPIFPGYVFVRLDLKDRLCVLKVPGIIYLVSFNGLPAPLSEREVDAMRTGLAQNAEVRPHPYTNVSAGQRVRICHGPFQGLEGKLIRRKGRFHVILSIELIQKSLLVDVEVSSVEFLTPPTR
jgi:transcription antitermination factor NusG